MREEDLLARARQIGALVGERLTALADKHGCVGDVRGRGAMMAVEVVGEDGQTPDPARAGAVSAHCHEQGVVTLTCGTYGNVLRFLPPLSTSDALLTEGFDVVAAAFEATA
jgi:4-aminobutyrate aminotransferase/(S)-3-amino-2-methylpropionate transaminase